MHHERLEKETRKILRRSEKVAKQFYALDEGEHIKEITDVILQSVDTKKGLKERIVATGRRFFLFNYPSDGFLVKGYLSFIPNTLENPLLVLLRGGNRVLGLMHPATDITCNADYTVLATTYRGGVSEGTDEFGGNDVNDVSHLLDFFPELQQKIGIQFMPKKTFILGLSRGGMEMFLALSRLPALQDRLTKIVSLSGLLSIKENMKTREDMRKMCEEDFGYDPKKGEEWIEHREVVACVTSIRRDLPILILQGSDDIRVGLTEGYQVVKALQDNGNQITYKEVEGGDHCLANQPDRMDIIVDWLES